MRRAFFILTTAIATQAVMTADSVLAGSAAVLPFTNISAPASAANEWIGESLAEALRESLRSRGLPAIPRVDVMHAYGELRLRPAAELTQASVLKVGQTLNADRVIYGTFRLDAAGSITVQATIADRAKAMLSPSLQIAGPLAELDRLEAQLAWQALAWMSPPHNVEESRYRVLRPEVRLAAEEQFIRGWVADSAEQREKFYQQAAKLDAMFARPVLELGRMELERKNYKGAAEWLTKVAAADPHYPEASFFLGVARFRLNDFAGAQAAFERITRSLPVAEVFNNLGVAESRRGSLHALSSFRQALELEPIDADYHFNMGYMLFKTGQYEAAADRFRAVLDRNPSDQSATVLLGRALKREGLRKGNAADVRFESAERFKETYEEPLFREPAPEPAPE